jgi:hypothetical protein
MTSFRFTTIKTIEQFHLKIQQCANCGTIWNPNNLKVSVSLGSQTLQGTFTQDGSWPNVIFSFTNPFVINTKMSIAVNQSPKNVHYNGYQNVHCKNVCSYIASPKIILKQNSFSVDIESSSKMIPVFGIAFTPT